ncbi:MAG: flagellar basal body L-ring protein FlgH [Bryobacterales bacterium]|nr:flagellar basal body L-ring protein FlgH [Bryobacterales bacterium]
MRTREGLAFATLLFCGAVVAAGERRRGMELSPLDEYVRAASTRPGDLAGASPGSLFAPGAALADLARDPRAYRLDDIVTIVVSDRASAIARGVTNTSRKSNSSSGISALAGALAATNPLTNLASLAGSSKVDGQGETSRETELTTTLSARVTHVLPNGYLVLEGTKNIAVNSERQLVIVRGVCRPQDLSPANQVRSDRLGQLEVKVSGKGVVADAVRRPFILYRLLEGILPF